MAGKPISRDVRPYALVFKFSLLVFFGQFMYLLLFTEYASQLIHPLERTCALYTHDDTAKSNER